MEQPVVKEYSRIYYKLVCIYSRNQGTKNYSHNAFCVVAMLLVLAAQMSTFYAKLELYNLSFKPPIRCLVYWCLIGGERGQCRYQKALNAKRPLNLHEFTHTHIYIYI